MIGPDFLLPADGAELPLLAGMAEGDRDVASAVGALPHLLAAREAPRLTSDAIVARVAGLLDDLAERLAQTVGKPVAGLASRLCAALRAEPAVISHCHALAIEWELALRLEADLALDPVAAPVLSSWLADAEGTRAELAMAALAAQSRFAQAQRRMEMPLEELPAEVLHTVLTLASATMALSESEDARARQKAIRSAYDEAATRLAIMSRLAEARMGEDDHAIRVEEAGVALWASQIAARSRQDRDTLLRACVAPRLERLLLTLRAAGLSAGEVQRQAIQLQPEAIIPAGLDEIGIREAARWLAEAGQ